jgi:antitoxin component YwqK of YwqJK toxin-antitoxin module
MRRILSFLFFFCAVITIASAQQYKYYLDNNLSSTTEKAALFIGKGMFIDTAFKLDCFNKFNNKLIMSIHFTDSTLGEMDGGFKSYYENGIIENTGLFANNLEEGVWIKRDTIGLLTDSSYYNKGVKLSYAKFEYNKYKQLSTFEFTDSIKNTFQYISYDSTGKKTLDVNFLGNNGIYNKYDSGKVITTKVFTRDMIEAKCEKFKKHLETNLRPNIGMENGAKPGLYQVIIKFIVNIDGTISDIEAETKFGFGMETEAIRVIKNSPKWTGASFFGIPVRAYRRQPITFLYSTN